MRGLRGLVEQAGQQDEQRGGPAPFGAELKGGLPAHERERGGEDGGAFPVLPQRRGELFEVDHVMSPGVNARVRRLIDFKYYNSAVSQGFQSCSGRQPRLRASFLRVMVFRIEIAFYRFRSKSLDILSIFSGI